MNKVKELSRENLEKSYENLERAFTKKCQELSELKKMVVEPVHENQDVVERVAEEVCDILPVEESDEESLEVNEDCVVLQENIVNDGEEDCMITQGKDLRMRAVEFLRENQNAKPYAKEISKILLKDKSILNCVDPFRVAFGLAVANASGSISQVNVQHENNEVVAGTSTRPTIEDEVLAGASTRPTSNEGVGKPKVQVLNSSMIGSAPRKQDKKYRSFEDARSELLRLFE